MQTVTITFEENRNAYQMLRLLKGFDFVRSIHFENKNFAKILSEEHEIFDDELSIETYLEDFGMTVSDLRNEILHDETEKGMSKQEFFNSMKQWRATIDK